MAKEKHYTPTSSYAELKEVADKLATAQSADQLRTLCQQYGTKIGYKAFCYLMTNKMTAESMQPDQSAEIGVKLLAQGQTAAAREIFKRIVAFYPEHPIAKQHL